MLKNCRLPVFALLLALLLAACQTAVDESTPTPIIPPTAVAGSLQVTTAVSEGPISPYILGSNYGPWVAVPVDMLPAAYDSGVTAVRFPGGAWGDRNDLKPYHIDPFMQFVGQVGAMPTISVRLREGSAEQAADLVRYVNVEKGYGVQYWSIGNEPTLFAAELQTSAKADDYETVQYNQEWREFALAMKEVDPTIKVMGPEVHQFTANYDNNPKDSANLDWMEQFLKANGDLVDVVTFHRYPFPRSNTEPTASIDDLRQHTQEWQYTMAYLRQLIQEITGRDIPIALTEFNTHYNQAIGGEATPDSHYNAIWLAETFGQMIKQDLFMANHWMLTSQGGQGGWGLITRGEVRPSYYVYQLYSQFGSELLHAESGVTAVSVYAAKRDDGALTVLVINLADEAQQATLQMDTAVPAQADLWRLDPENKPETANTVTLSADQPLELPGQSITLLVFADFFSP